jgi:ABC-2 type transport system permease protein
MLPLLTMGVFAEEKKMGTLELLWTYPVVDGQILLAKFLGCLTIFSLITLLNMVYPLVLWVFYKFSWGPVFACFAGFFLLGVLFISCGVLTSYCTEHEIVAALVSFSAFLLFWFLTWNEAAFSAEVLGLLLHISVFDRFKPFSQGVVFLRDVIYFLAASCLFLTITLRAMKMRNGE